MSFRVAKGFAWLGTLAFTAALAPADVPGTQPKVDRPVELSEFRTVDTAIRAHLQPTTQESARVGYLGIALAPERYGKVVVDTVNPSSPAAGAGFKEGDVILRADGEALARAQTFRDWLLTHVAGDSVRIDVLRDGKEQTLSATLAPVSRPMSLNMTRVMIGVQIREVTQGEGVLLDHVTPGGAADRAGLAAGDVVAEVNGTPIANRAAFTESLYYGRNPGDEVKLTVKRGGKVEDFHVRLVAERNSTSAPTPDRKPEYFGRGEYHLAVIGVEYPDVKHNPKISTRDWEQSIFSTAAYHTTSATSQPAFGSVNDYYLEDSAGHFHLEGKMFDWIELSKNRAEYGFGTGDNGKMLPETLDKLLEREGKNALDGYDGFAIIYAGERVATTRGGLFWPHKGFFAYGGKRWNYLIVGEGGAKMTNISVFCHEFGHMLGLPDLYARPENPGSEGLGFWCLMSNQITTGRPQHMSAWCKEQLGWLQPTVIDPTIRQRLVLSPVEGSKHECFKVLVKPDGSEYLLLEVRRKTGFDSDLAGEGLLIWRVVGGHPFLVASHGIQGPAAPRSYPIEVPFPSIANTSFTPYTTPSSRSQMGGGLPVYITEIKRMPEGKVSFAIGYEFF